MMNTQQRKQAGNPRRIRAEPVEFSIADHLWVQRQIENRAYALWREGGGASLSALEYWVQAETEVIEGFCAACASRN
jgi:hypothetical protein